MKVSKTRHRHCREDALSLSSPDLIASVGDCVTFSLVYSLNAELTKRNVYIIIDIVLDCIRCHLYPRDAVQEGVICCSAVSVCLSVCHDPILYQNGSTYRRDSFTTRQYQHLAF